MTDHLYFLKEESDFAQGTPENVRWLGDGLALNNPAGDTAMCGTYTTPIVPAPAFAALAASWNADTPEGCTVELCARVQADGQWSGWLHWGTWGLFVPRASTPGQGNALARLEDDILRVQHKQGATAFQLRLTLHGTPAATPVVHLVCAALHTLRRQPQRGSTLQQKNVPVPAYSLRIRDTRLAAQTTMPAAIAMLMNRWGEDVLPEEAAYACYDYGTQGYNSRPFALALAGACGFECFAVFTDAEGLKREVKNGFGCGVRLVADGPDATASPQALVVRGFDTAQDGTEYVLVNNPLAATDAEAQQRLPLDDFLGRWDGTACLLHRRRSGRPCGPVRVAGELRRTELPGEYALYVKGKRHSLPTDLCTREGRCTGTVCYTVQDDHAYATTAHKRFYYTNITPSGNIRLDTGLMPSGTRLTAYVITELGKMVVAGLTL